MNILAPGIYRQLTNFYLQSCAYNFNYEVEYLRRRGYEQRGRGAFGGIYTDYESVIKLLLQPTTERNARAHYNEVRILDYLRKEQFPYGPMLFGVSGPGINKSIRMENLFAYYTFYSLHRHMLQEYLLLDIYVMQRYAVELFQAVDKLHELGIAHLDIKSDNVMMSTETVDVRLIDFNKALRCGDLLVQQTPVAPYAPGFNSIYHAYSWEDLVFLDDFATAVLLWETSNGQTIAGDQLCMYDVTPNDAYRVVERRQRIIDGNFGMERVSSLILRGFGIL